MDNQLIEGIDFNYDENGLMVLTSEYLFKRGRCCQSGCRNCPYEYAEQVDPTIPAELAEETQSSSNIDSTEIYSGEIPEEFL